MASSSTAQGVMLFGLDNKNGIHPECSQRAGAHTLVSVSNLRSPRLILPSNSTLMRVRTSADAAPALWEAMPAEITIRNVSDGGAADGQQQFPSRTQQLEVLAAIRLQRPRLLWCLCASASRLVRALQQLGWQAADDAVIKRAQQSGPSSIFLNGIELIEGDPFSVLSCGMHISRADHTRFIGTQRSAIAALLEAAPAGAPAPRAPVPRSLLDWGFTRSGAGQSAPTQPPQPPPAGPPSGAATPSHAVAPESPPEAAVPTSPHEEAAPGPDVPFPDNVSVLPQASAATAQQGTLAPPAVAPPPPAGRGSGRGRGRGRGRGGRGWSIDRPHVCGLCDASFKDTNGLAQHRRNVVHRL